MRRFTETRYNLIVENMTVRSDEVVINEIRELCGRFQECTAEVEKWSELDKVQYQLEEVCKIGIAYIDITKPALLIVLMDAYEITRNEKMLQQVLDVVSKNVDQLKVSTEGVKLLAYCYYYVEEEECVVKAREMLKELKRRGEQIEELAEVERIVEELI